MMVDSYNAALANESNSSNNTQVPKLISPQIVNQLETIRSDVISSRPSQNIQAKGYTTQSQVTVLPSSPKGQSIHILSKPQSLVNCPCAGVVKICPVCGVDDPNDFGGCPCDSSRPACPPCILAKTVKEMHIKAAENAKIDSKNQENLAKKSDLERQLFAQARKYASEAQKEEEISYKLSLELQQHSSKAQIARNNMIRAENQAKQLAMETIQAMSVYPSHPGVSVPGLSIKQTGVKRSAIYQSQPQYQLQIQNTDASGFIDQNDFDFQQAIEQSKQQLNSQDQQSQSSE